MPFWKVNDLIIFCHFILKCLKINATKMMSQFRELKGFIMNKVLFYSNCFCSLLSRIFTNFCRRKKVLQFLGLSFLHSLPPHIWNNKIYTFLGLNELLIKYVMIQAYENIFLNWWTRKRFCQLWIKSNIRKLKKKCSCLIYHFQIANLNIKTYWQVARTYRLQRKILFPNYMFYTS